MRTQFLWTALTIKDKRTNIPSQKYNWKERWNIQGEGKYVQETVMRWKTRQQKGWKASDK